MDFVRIIRSIVIIRGIVVIRGYQQFRRSSSSLIYTDSERDGEKERGKKLGNQLESSFTPVRRKARRS